MMNMECVFNVLCLHALAFLIAAKGSLNSMTSGYIHAISKASCSLEPSEKNCVVLITTDHSYVFCFFLIFNLYRRVTISNDNNITLAISRSL